MGGKVSRREWRGVLIFAAVVTLVTLIPYGVGWLRAGEAWLFNGFTFGLDDGNAYLGKMRIGAQGGWQFYLFYTPEAHQKAFGLYLPYIVIGHLVRLIAQPEGAQLVTALAVAFQVWRIVACFLLFLSYYRFAAFFLRSPQTRWLALILAALGGGLGWLLALAGQEELFGTLPVDFYIPEGFSFLALYGLPHIAMSRAAMLFGFLLLFAALRENKLRYALLAGICWTIVGLMVTFYLAVLYVLLAAWGAGLWLRLRRFPANYALKGGLAAAVTLPLFAYNSWLFTANEAFAQWSRQNDLPSPHPLHYVIGYGVLGLFAISGGRWAWRRSARPQGEAYALLAAWVVIAPLLVYLPLNVQRRLAEGVIVPLAILAAAGIKLGHSIPSLGRKFRRTRLIVLGMVLPSAGLFWLITLVGLLKPNCTGEVCPYRSQAEVDALNWLADYAEPNAVVMGSFRSGNFLPIQTDLRPFWGHGPETLYSEDKARWVRRFYTGELSPTERDHLLRDFRIQYVIFGALEREIASDPSVWNETMTVIYDHDNYSIYEVNTP